MTYEEAQRRRIEMLKIDIRRRLHRYNPEKYPNVPKYSGLEAFSVAFELNRKAWVNAFAQDSLLLKYLRR